MTPFRDLRAVAAPLPLANVDTDKILPGRFLKTITRAGLGNALFSALREDPCFVLNKAPYSSAGILVTLENFGCGSSREHAPWALCDFGIQCVIAPSIADIFYNNCFKNGILAIVLDPGAVMMLLNTITNPSTSELFVDLNSQEIVTLLGDRVRFDIDGVRKGALLRGDDEISKTLSLIDHIHKFENVQSRLAPWLVEGIDSGLLIE